MIKANEFLLKKSIAIVDNIINTSKAILNLQAKVYPKKKLRICKKTKKHPRILRRDKNFNKMLLLMTPAIGIIQHDIISSQPIPKFKNGSNTSGSNNSKSKDAPK